MTRRDHLDGGPFPCVEERDREDRVGRMGGQGRADEGAVEGVELDRRRVAERDVTLGGETGNLRVSNSSGRDRPIWVGGNHVVLVDLEQMDGRVWIRVERADVLDSIEVPEKHVPVLSNESTNISFKFCYGSQRMN